MKEIAAVMGRKRDIWEGGYNEGIFGIFTAKRDTWEMVTTRDIWDIYCQKGYLVSGLKRDICRTRGGGVTRDIWGEGGGFISMIKGIFVARDKHFHVYISFIYF